MQFNNHLTRRRRHASAVLTLLLAALGPGFNPAAASHPGAHEPSGAETAFTFPPEWQAHDAVWMGWGARGGGPHPEGFIPLWAEMLRALTPHVTVKMTVTSPAREAEARAALAERGVDLANVVFIEQPFTDIWMRDFGPLFLSDGKRKKLATFAWSYYGFPWPFADAGGLRNGEIDQNIAETFSIGTVPSAMIAEGGGLEVSSDILIAYRDAALHRNPGHSIAEIEAEYLRLYGKKKLIWLSRAPISDRVFAGPKVANFFGWGANGHTDEYVRFVDDNTILVAQVPEEEKDRNAFLRLEHEILKENLKELRAARGTDGRPFRVIPVTMPDVTALMQSRQLREEDFHDPETGWDARSVYRGFTVGDEINWMPAASYMNYLVTNGVVLVAKYWEENLPETLRKTDEEVRRVLAAQYPGRTIVQINPLVVNWNGGGMHCITQQEPEVAAPAPG